jgi:hypothetical protein
MGTGVVGRQESTDRELAGLNHGDVIPDLLHGPAEFVTIALARVTWSMPRYGHRSDPQTQVATVRTMASGRCSQRTSLGA